MWFHYIPPAHIIPYIIFIITLIVLIIHIYIRLSYGFWYYQPVFHYYDWRYYFFPCGIIEHEFPEKNRYTNLTNIETLTFDKLETQKYKLQDFIFLIQQHYMKQGDLGFSPKEENIVPYFTGHNHPCFFSFYYKDEILQDVNAINNKSESSLVHNKQMIGAITGRPLHIMINKNQNHKKSHDNWNTFNVYYVDYLCVNKMHRKKNTAAQMIQTLYYHQRRKNTKICVSLFKREGQITGIVPLCTYTTVGFSMETWFKRPPMDPAFKVVKCSGHNIRFLLDFMKDTRNGFDICISPELSNVLDLIKTDNIYVYTLMDTANDCVLAAYFFRKVCTYIEKGKEYLSLFASISKTENVTFVDGFHIALAATIPKTDFHYLAIENISHNGGILNGVREKHTPVSETPMAYFFYNFAYHTFSPQKTFILS
jgi:hypothetical protein